MAKTWGVIARSEATGEVGTAANKLSEDEARSVAIYQCALGGATDCKIYLDVETQPGFPPISAAHASLPKLVEFPIPRPVDHAVQVAAGLCITCLSQRCAHCSSTWLCSCGEIRFRATWIFCRWSYAKA